VNRSIRHQKWPKKHQKIIHWPYQTDLFICNQAKSLMVSFWRLLFLLN
jgi:hypothetical protein